MTDSLIPPLRGGSLSLGGLQRGSGLSPSTGAGDKMRHMFDPAGGSKAKNSLPATGRQVLEDAG